MVFLMHGSAKLAIKRGEDNLYKWCMQSLWKCVFEFNCVKLILNYKERIKFGDIYIYTQKIIERHYFEIKYGFKDYEK
jgi:hypothetical protein